MIATFIPIYGVLTIAITSEIGDNSFAHNLGSWPDTIGIFFAYDIRKREVVLADRGNGILSTLKRVKPSLRDHIEALQTAFTEIISGRAPESRGNGLKFVRREVINNKLNLIFYTGDAVANIKEGRDDLKIKKSKTFVRGCLAFLKF